MWTSLCVLILQIFKDKFSKSWAGVLVGKFWRFRLIIYIAVGIIALLIALLLVYDAGDAIPQPDSPKVESQPETSPPLEENQPLPEAPSPTDLMELWEDPETNNTMDRYIGLPITVEGTVERIHERKRQSDGVTFNPYREIDVTVGLANDTFPQIVRISMDVSRWQEEIDSTDPGDSIKARGTLFEIDRNFLRVTQGEFIP